MNATIDKIIHLLFEDIEETEETRAIHDEILTNCQERYADLVQNGMSEDDAIHAVVESLNGMEDMLKDFPRKPAEVPKAEAQDWTLDPALSPIREIHCLDMGRADIAIEPSSDGLIHVLCEDDSIMLLTSIDTGVLSIALTNQEEKSKVQAEISFDLTDLRGMFEKLARCLVNMTSSCRIRICIPHGLGASVRVHTGSGDAEISSVALESLTVATASGDIMLKDLTVSTFMQLDTASGDICGEDLCAGKLETNTASGDVMMHDVCISGDVDLNSASGDMEWMGSCNELQTGTSSGDLRLSGEFKVLDFNTSSGDAKVMAAGNMLKGLNGNTSSGDLQVQLPPNLPVSIVCRSRSGDIAIKCVSIPQSSVTVEISSVSGDISVR